MLRAKTGAFRHHFKPRSQGLSGRSSGSAWASVLAAAFGAGIGTSWKSWTGAPVGGHASRPQKPGPSAVWNSRDPTTGGNGWANANRRRPARIPPTSSNSAGSHTGQIGKSQATNRGPEKPVIAARVSGSSGAKPAVAGVARTDSGGATEFSRWKPKPLSRLAWAGGGATPSNQTGIADCKCRSPAGAWRLVSGRADSQSHSGRCESASDPRRRRNSIGAYRSDAV